MIDKQSYFKKFYKFWLRFRASVSLPPPGANEFDLSKTLKGVKHEENTCLADIRRRLSKFQLF